MVPSDTAYTYFITVAVAADEVRSAGDFLAAAMANNQLRPGRNTARIVGCLNEMVRARCAAAPGRSG